jgi:hypothetical protein
VSNTQAYCVGRTFSSGFCKDQPRTDLWVITNELGVDATFVKVTNLAEIMAYDIVGTPALVIDETVVSSGRVPLKDEIAGWIEAIEHTE